MGAKCFDISTAVWRETCVRMIHVLAILSLFLASLQACECSHGHGPRSTAVQPYSSLDMDGLLYRSDGLLLNGRQKTKSNGSPAPATFHLATRRRKLRDATRTISGTAQERREYNSTRAPDMEVEALIAFKGAISSDPLDALGSWNIGDDVNGSDTCSGWVGITCSPQFPNHVVALNLSNLQLVANLNSALLALGHLTFLQSLDFNTNDFSGSIQGEALANLSHLSYLNVSHNMITGNIPSEIGELVYLQYLDITNNSMTGPIPESLGNCSLMRSIDLSVNTLEGVIPTSLGRLSGLQVLNLSHITSFGDVPSSLGNCSSLVVLNLAKNYLVGGLLPQEISNLKKLQVLVLDFCDFLAFPSWIVNLTSLIEFSAFGNQIRGEIPENIGELQSLEIFIVAENNMTGFIPLSVYNLTALTKFHNALNNFSGPLPSQIGLLPNLQTLLTQYNRHTGSIPSSLANCSTLYNLGPGSNPMDPEPIPSWIGSLTNLLYVDFRNMNLQGSLPGNSIAQLSNLQKIQFDKNNLTGTIPTAWKNCTSLDYLSFWHNSLTGGIPSELGALGKMFWFGINSNYITGFFPEVFANWTELAYLNLQDNNLNGPLDGHLKIDQLGQLQWLQAGINDFEGAIPEAIGNSSSILSLYLNENRLSGAIPDSLGNMTNLQKLDLHGNMLQGPIPISLLVSGRLVQLDLSHNKLERNIPFQIGQLSDLTELKLNDNMLTGVIPSSIANFSQMSTLNLSGNQLEGSIPADAISGMSSSLTSLDLSHNRFVGSWPVEFEELINVQIINVSFNNISGSISLGLGKCINLKTLDISFNNLTGDIPQDLGELAHLEFFNASFNEFTGPIPVSGIFSTNRINGSSFLGNPGLCGPIAIIGPRNHQDCAVIPQNANSHGDCKGFKCKQVWIPIAAVGMFFLVGATFIIVGIKFRWILNKGERECNSAAHVMVNFSSHMRLSQQDVLRTINLENVIGVGGRSIVYKGVLLGGEPFALKKVLLEGDVNNQDSSSKMTGVVVVDTEGEVELLKEAKILAKLRHKNIVSCYSFYSNLDHKALILEYVSGGSLHKHLHEIDPCELAWQTRLKVAVGVAEGLKYLHHDFPEPLIHRDLKPNNILLDAEFQPKVCDFDISKFVGQQSDGQASASTLCGTIGYMPPEYSSQPWVSTKGDVYSYGVVLIEMLTQRQPCQMNALEGDGGDLRNWVLDSFHERPLDVLDPSLKRECSLDNTAVEQMTMLLRVSLFCTRMEPQSRPSMIDVVGMLTDIISLGTEPLTRRTLEELAHDSCPNTWTAEDPTIEGAEFGSS